MAKTPISISKIFILSFPIVLFFMIIIYLRHQGSQVPLINEIKGKLVEVSGFNRFRLQLREAQSALPHIIFFFFHQNSM